MSLLKKLGRREADGERDELVPFLLIRLAQEQPVINQTFDMLPLNQTEHDP
jgi:hypothetical protein